MSSEGLVVDGVSAGYGPVRVLHDVSIEVRPGEVVSVVGANGAGKSTLLRTISGRLRPTEGRVKYRGTSALKRAPAAMCRLGIGHAPEGRQLFQSLTVKENLQLGVYTIPRRSRKSVIQERLSLVCSLFPILEEFSDRKAGELSGGQQQMLSLGRALMARPTLLLLDEPSMGLAPGPVGDIASAVRKLSAAGVSVLLVEQVVGLALDMSTRTYILRNGRVRAQGSSAELQREPGLLHEAYFGVEETK